MIPAGGDGDILRTIDSAVTQVHSNQATMQVNQAAPRAMLANLEKNVTTGFEKLQSTDKLLGDEIGKIATTQSDASSVMRAMVDELKALRSTQDQAASENMQTTVEDRTEIIRVHQQLEDVKTSHGTNIVALESEMLLHQLEITNIATMTDFRR